jgi:hypothetical protein
MTFGIVTDYGHTYKFYSNHYFFVVVEELIHGDGAKFLGYVGT